MTTTISVSKDTKAQFDEERPERCSSADEFVSLLLDFYADEDVHIGTGDTADVDPGKIADAVAARLEGSKPLEDMAFEDWFEPDYAQTIAHHVSAEVDTGDVTLEADERTKIAREVAGMLR